MRRSAEYGFVPVKRSAEHGFTSVKRSAEHGFTLVELMVVVTVIALAAGAVVWSLPSTGSRVGDEAARFALRVRAARDAAITSARPVSVWVTPAGYGFEQRVAGGWVPLGDRPLRVERWADGTRAVLAEQTGRARTTFDPTGLADRPLEVHLTRRAADVTVHIGVDGAVAIDA